MFSIPLPGDHYALLLSPRWSGLGLTLQVLSLTLLGAVPLLLVLWLYRYELRLVRRRTAAGLLSLRLAVIGLLWLLIALQPVVARAAEEELPSRVLIAVDRSASMDVPDPQRPVVEKLRLAQVLRLQGTDTELSQQVDKLTRTDVARAVLEPEGLNLIRALAARHKVELIGFHRDAWGVSAEQANDLFRVPASGNSFTDLRQPLLKALERSHSAQGRILGVLLLSDGQHNWGDSPAQKAVELGERKIPVFPVALGAKDTPPDIALIEVKAPANVFKGADATVEARFKVSGLPAQELKVELHQAGKPPADEHIKTLRHDGSDRFYSVRFQVRMGQPGTHSLEVKVRPSDERTAEITKENNQRQAVVRVAKERAKVLLIDGEARWEYHYLANALLRDRTVASESVVFLQPRISKVSELELVKSGHPRLTLPVPADGDKTDPLAKYDCIVLGDVSPEQLPPAQRRRLEKYVADRGGTLVVLAGKRYMPLAFLKGQKAGGESDPLLKLLPVEDARAVTPPAGFPVTLTHEGNLTPFLQMESSPEASAQRWAELPHHYWGVVGRAKPGAAALAFVAGAAPAGPADKDGPERTQALIVSQNYGFGRVLFVGLDSTWRWRYKIGDLYHHRFWGQLVRWAASDRLLPAGNRYVRFGSREPVYRQGKQVELVARLEDEAGPLPADIEITARVLRQIGADKEETTAAVRLTAGQAQPRVFQGLVPDLAEGRYRIELDIPQLRDKLQAPPEDEDNSVKERRDTFTVLPSDSGEMLQLATNWPLLESLAARSRGEVLTPENVGRILDLLEKQVVRRERREEQKLWQDAPLVWWVLGLFLLLLTVEWVGRKLAGLP